jgi:uncharacterized protein
MRWIVIIILYCLIPLRTAWSSELVLHIGKYRISATIVNTQDARKRGLMQKTSLCESCGMLFVFPQAGKYNFWMKDTVLPLSIAFISADGSIINIDEMQANSLDTHSARGNALYVLEMNKAWFQQHGIRPGNRVEGLELAPPGY